MSREIASRRSNFADLPECCWQVAEPPWEPQLQPALNHPGMSGRTHPDPGQHPEGMTWPPVATHVPKVVALQAWVFGSTQVTMGPTSVSWDALLNKTCWALLHWCARSKSHRAPPRCPMDCIKAAKEDRALVIGKLGFWRNVATEEVAQTPKTFFTTGHPEGSPVCPKTKTVPGSFPGTESTGARCTQRATQSRRGSWAAGGGGGGGGAQGLAREQDQVLGQSVWTGNPGSCFRDEHKKQL